MGKVLEDLNVVVGLGIVLAIALMFGVAADTVSAVSVLSWLHLFFGVMWIGLLYYFNFVQIPAMPTIPAELKPGVTKYIAPKALFFFRWGAAFTVLTGLSLAWVKDYLHQAMSLTDPVYRLIGIGMWLALIMAFNVWFVIWPNQKKALGLVDAEPDVKAKAARTAMLFSRTNVLLSLPMFYAMVNANQG